MPNPWRPWPYAALCIAQWLHIAPTLSVYVIFRHPMDQTLKPPLAKWIVYVDGVPKTPASSAWSDDWTLILTVAAIAVLPAVVKVEYDGPHADLQTTWGKQWEPWGPIVAESFEFIPSNIIVMFHGAVVDIPPGWFLCDGNNGTPNLKNRFVLQTGILNPVGATGGNKFHTHTFTGDGHGHVLGVGGPLEFLYGSTERRYIMHNEAIGTTDQTDGRPPYYTLAFIMKA